MATPTTDPTLDIDDRRNCEIEATVVTGFENIARTEALQKVPYSKVRCERGRIFITTTMAGVQKVLALSSIDNCYVVMSRFPDVILSQNQMEVMRTIRELVRTVDWENGLRAWQRVFTFQHPVLYRPEVVPESLGEPVIVQRKNSVKKRKLDGTESATKENAEENSKVEKETDVSSKIEKQDKSVPQNSEQPGVKNSTIKDKLGEDSIHSETDQSKEGSKNATDPTNEQPERVRQTAHDPTKLTFRVTCNRTGDHCFQSMCAAANFGGAVYAYFNWNIDMKNFDVEVILNIDGSNVNVGIALTKESLHRRNIAHFGPTTLRPTIAFNMLRMCNIRPGDVICDPMCGGGTIPIEASVNWPDCVHLCGEIHAIGAGRSRDNIDTLNAKRIEKGKPPVKVDVLRWDANAMPLGESSVDVFISDLPFGKRIGHKVDNWKLYPSSMLEMARVCRPETGRACFLTHDKRCMIKTIHGLKKFWRQVRSVGVNIGGLSAVVFLLYRTAKTVSPEDVAPTADVLRKLPGDLPVQEKETK